MTTMLSEKPEAANPAIASRLRALRFCREIPNKGHSLPYHA